MPIALVLLPTTPNVRTPEASGVTEDDKPYYDIGTKAKIVELKPRAAVTLGVKFVYASTVRFTYTTQVLGVVQTPNRNPEADAGPDQTVSVGTNVQLSGAGSQDPDNDPLTFAWQFAFKPAGSTATLANANTVSPSFTADVAGTYTLTLTVSDGKKGEDTDSVNITATAVKHPPAITSTPGTTATVGQNYQYDVEATDPDAGDILTYLLQIAPAGLTINATAGLIEWTPTIAQVGTHDVTVRVQYQGGLFAEQSFSIVVASVPVTVSVPNVVGLVQAAAQTAITAENLTVGTITTANSNTVPAGNIISQTPTAGVLVAPQTAVNLVVSLEPVPTVTVPSVIGQTQSAAQTTLTGAKLALGAVSMVDSDHALSFTTLPSTQGWLYVPFGNTATETQVFSLNSNVLQQNTLGLADGFNFYQLLGVVQPTLPFTLTVTARVLAQEGEATDAFGFGFAVAVGTQQFAFGLRTGSIHDPVGNILSTTIDTTQFHEYRLEGTPGGGYRLFVDGVFLGSGSAGTRTTAAQFLSFGDLSDTANARGEISSLSFVQNVGTVAAQPPAAGSPVAGGPGRKVGEQLLEHADVLFAWRRWLREGKWSRSTWHQQMRGLRHSFRQELQWGTRVRCKKTAAERALWTFVRIPEVHETNNAAERSLRPPVQ